MLEYSFHIQIQGVQLQETQPRPAIVAPHPVRPALTAVLLASAKPTPSRGTPSLHTPRATGGRPALTLRTQLVALPQAHRRKPRYSFHFLRTVRLGLVSAPPGLGPPGRADWRASLNPRMGVAVGGVDKGQGPLPSSWLREPHSQSCAPC